MSGSQYARLQFSDVLTVNQFVINGRNRILPNHRFGRHQWSNTAIVRTEIAVCQLVPRLGERIGKCIGVSVKTARYRLIVRIDSKGQIRREHHGWDTSARAVGDRHQILVGDILRCPLPRARRTLGEFPFIAEEHVEIAVVPTRRCGSPRPFKATCRRMHANTAPEGIPPSETLLLDARTLRLRANQGRVPRTMALAEGVPTGNQCHGLGVVHRHPGKGLPDVMRRGGGIGLSVRPFRIDVDEAHLHGGKRIFEVAFPGISFVAQPLGFGAPVHVLLRFPDILASTGKTVGPESHRLQCAVAGKNHQVRPRYLPPVLPLDRPEQTARLVEIAVVGPTVERCKTLRAGRCATPPVLDAVGSRTVPRHADEQRSVMTVVGRPPVLAVGHQRVELLSETIQIQAFELRRIVERITHRVRPSRVLLQPPEAQLVGPPSLVGQTARSHQATGAAHHRTFAGVLSRSSVHLFSNSVF